MLPPTPGGRRFFRVAHQVRVSRRGRYLVVAEQLADRGEPLAQRQRPRGVRMPEVMDSHVIKPGSGPDALPVGSEIQGTTRPVLSGEHPGVSR